MTWGFKSLRLKEGVKINQNRVMNVVLQSMWRHGIMGSSK
jgi:hypothetical protein